MKNIRAFIAVDYPASVKQTLLTHIRQGKKLIDSTWVRWVPESNMHLTLKFLGEVEQKQLDTLTGLLKELGAQYEPFALTVSGQGVFPNPRRPRILWIGAEECPTLTHLAADIDQAAAKISIPPEERGFTPHLTIGRVAKDLPDETLAKLAALYGRLQIKELGRFTVDHITLYQSSLLPEGPKYTPLAVIPLAKPVQTVS
jgi:2'-5' RNA ligase